VVIEVYQEGTFLLGKCRCGIGRLVIGGNDEGHPIPAAAIAANVATLIEYARGCEAAQSSTDRLYDQLVRERYGIKERQH
jgi:hypothetical protein